MTDKKLLGRKPTLEMIEAGIDSLYRGKEGGVWECMWDAAPTPDAPADGLIERLRATQVRSDSKFYISLCQEAADALAAKDAEIAAIRELMNCYNLGGWTDAESAMKRALAAEAEIAELRADAERYRTWSSGTVIVRKAADGDGWEARHHDDPHWDIGSWFWKPTLDEAIDAALSAGVGKGRAEG